MSLPLSNTPSFNTSSNNSPYYQEWSASPPAAAPFVYLQLDPQAIPMLTVDLKTKDVMHLYPNIVQFKLESTKQKIPNINLFNVDSLVFSFDQNAPIILNPQFKGGIFNVYMQNLASKFPGLYSYNLKFKIFGLSNGTWQMLSDFIYPVQVRVIADSDVWAEPAQCSFSHIQGNALPTLQFKVAGPSWSVFLDSKYVLSTSTTGLVYDVIGTTTKVTGTGIVIFSATLSEFFNTPEALAAATFTDQILIQKGSSSQMIQIPITAAIFGPAQFSVSPSSLNFTGIKTVAEPLGVGLTAISPNSITIVKDAWLELQDITTPSNSLIRKYIAKPMPTANMPVGFYQGNIKFLSSLSGLPVQKDISVVYDLQNFQASPYNADKFFFTLENETVNFATAAIDSYLTLDLSVLHFDYNTHQPTTTVLPYKIPLFKNRGSINIAEVVGRLMEQMSVYNPISAPQYKPAIVSYTTKEIGVDGAILQEQTVSGIKFIVGRKPEQVINNAAMLTQNEVPTRITRKGFAFINMLLPFGNYIVEIYKNQELTASYGFTIHTSNVYCRRLDFAPLDIAPGDVIDYKVNTNGASSKDAADITKRFLCFPDALNSTFIAWQENNNLKNVLEFTGEFKLETDIENVFHTYRRDNTDVLEKLSSSKNGRFQIDTGWITKAEHVTIESLMMSNKAWIMLNNVAVQMVALSKQIKSSDSDEGLISYTIECQINKSHDAQVYNF